MIISIITPFYHGNGQIKKLIMNVDKNAVYLHSEYPEINVELVIVNDSPELEVDAETGQPLNDIHIRIIKNKRNSGIHFSRAAGLKASGGEYIVFLDQDDVIDNQYLLKQYKKIRNNDIVVCGGIHKYSDHSVRLYKNRYQFECVKQFKKYIKIRQMIASPGQCLIRRKAVPDEWCEMILQNNGADDFFLWILMFAKGIQFEVNDEILYNHVITGKNCSADLRKMDASVNEMLECLKNVGYMKKRTLKVFIRCNRYKQNFRYADKRMKLLYSIKNIDLAVLNIVFYIRSTRKDKDYDGFVE